MKNDNKNKKQKTKKPAGLPTREEILKFINESPTPVSKRDIARAFHIHDDDRIALKRLLREFKDDGTIEKQHGRKVSAPDSLPDMATVEIVKALHDGDYVVRNVDEKAQEKNRRADILLHVSHHQERTLRLGDLGRGDRLLVHLTRESENNYRARPIKRVARPPMRIVGMIQAAGKGFRLVPTERKNRDEYVLMPEQEIAFAHNDIVIAEVKGGSRFGVKEARVKENIGPFDAPKAVSMMAIARQEIPWVFPESVEKEANSFAPPTLGNREDLRGIPLVTIDGADARDFDDAVFAEPDADNKGGWVLYVAIADVSNYVKSGSPLDREAYKRGNSVYFPDRVVPMLPEALSNELCSLKPKVDRACLAVRMVIDADGQMTGFRFTRGLMRSAARLTYEQVQAAADGKTDDTTDPLMEKVIRPLYAAYRVLLAARKKRGTLDLDVQENKISIGTDGKVAHIGARARLDAHKLIEEFMVLANVAAAEALEKRGMAGLYRVHDMPSVEKLEALRAFLKGFDIKLPHGQHLRSADLARVLEKFIGNDHAPVINEVMLRSQAQAIYSPENIGHFGLALARYAHFTSPIRRYADLIVHRGLIRLFKLGDDGLTDDEITRLDEIGEHISRTERRAIEAERESNDRYTALYMAGKIGEEFNGRVSGVTRSGLFVRLTDTGADGFIPITTLPNDFYDHDEANHMLVGRRHGRTFRLADILRIRLVEADPILGSCRFALTGEDGGSDRNDSYQPRKPAGALGPRRKREHGRRPGGESGPRRGDRDDRNRKNRKGKKDRRH